MPGYDSVCGLLIFAERRFRLKDRQSICFIYVASGGRYLLDVLMSLVSFISAYPEASESLYADKLLAQLVYTYVYNYGLGPGLLPRTLHGSAVNMF